MDKNQERHAINQLKKGDVNGLASLVYAYQHHALRTAYLVTQDALIAEDVAQTAFVKAYQHIETFDISRRFLPWFLRIVVNLSVHTMKKQARILPLDAAEETGNFTIEHLLSDAMPDPENEVEARELQEQIHTLLKQLSPEKRAVIVLRYYVDLTETEMSDLLEVPPGTIKSRLHTARQQLRRLLTLNST
ncbi:sigma-70 family RNA polymerase sigma factor [Phototrophicus methaneseepsis]|uniref:RNA polymerase sigma factor n=1 Tax=Phototrophicus methaneseepsis TaxID=2710758 RepID=A0A7S8ICR8_9CHLR|nr:sigma-70 family RNA polymerase sigma factor [Phototrophicus methaneseepsis]QPC80817.1 sigma-70 family RNA polymerase sigma factor [Phototrophicus methaneseepsis]